MTKTVEINEDSFIDMLWDRVNEFKPAQSYSDNFWECAFESLSDMGWLKPDYNTPMYIVDNIAINGEIYDFDECKEYYSEIDADYNGDVKEWAYNNGYEVCDDLVIIQWGL